MRFAAGPSVHNLQTAQRKQNSQLSNWQRVAVSKGCDTAMDVGKIRRASDPQTRAPRGKWRDPPTLAGRFSQNDGVTFLLVRIATEKLAFNVLAVRLQSV